MRQETGVKRQETLDNWLETEDKRRETGDVRQETWERRREKGDKRQVRLVKKDMGKNFWKMQLSDVIFMGQFFSLSKMWRGGANIKLISAAKTLA